MKQSTTIISERERESLVFRATCEAPDPVYEWIERRLDTFNEGRGIY